MQSELKNCVNNGGSSIEGDWKYLSTNVLAAVYPSGVTSEPKTSNGMLVIRFSKITRDVEFVLCMLLTRILILVPLLFKHRMQDN